MINSIPSASKTCTFCEADLELRTVTQSIPLITPDGQVMLCASVPSEFCSECGYEGFSEAGEQVRTMTVTNYRKTMRADF